MAYTPENNPYIPGDPYSYDLKWIVSKLKYIENNFGDFLAYNKLSFMGVYDASVIYPAWAIVNAPDGTGYVSVKAVPANVPLSNTDYWRLVAPTPAPIPVTVDNKRRYIIIGDSYANHVGTSGDYLFSIVQNGINATADDFYEAHAGGASFASATPELRYEYLLKSIENAVDDPDTITDIWIEGGANDGASTYAEQMNAILSFMTYAHATYPHATVYLFCVSTGFRYDLYTQKMERTIPAWKDSCIYGATYVTNSDYIMLDSSLYLTSDYVHPTAAGVDTIATYMISAILGRGSGVDVKHTVKLTLSLISNPRFRDNTLPSLTASYAHIEMILNNGKLSVYGGGGDGSILKLKMESSVAIPANNRIAVDLDGTLYPGCNWPYSGVGVPVLIYSDSNNEACPGFMYLRKEYNIAPYMTIFNNRAIASTNTLTIVPTGSLILP